MTWNQAAPIVGMQAFPDEEEKEDSPEEEPEDSAAAAQEETQGGPSKTRKLSRDTENIEPSSQPSWKRTTSPGTRHSKGEPARNQEWTGLAPHRRAAPHTSKHHSSRAGGRNQPNKEHGLRSVMDPGGKQIHRLLGRIPPAAPAATGAATQPLLPRPLPVHGKGVGRGRPVPHVVSHPKLQYSQAGESASRLTPRGGGRQHRSSAGTPSYQWRHGVAPFHQVLPTTKGAQQPAAPTRALPHDVVAPDQQLENRSNGPRRWRAAAPGEA